MIRISKDSFSLKSLIGVFLATAFLSLSGCGMLKKKVNAYERSTLSLAGMATIENAKEETAMQHMFNAREGSVGGFGGAGGGCGCN